MSPLGPPPGVILAGGAARRMGGGDKGLLALGRTTVLGHAVARLTPQVSMLAINANGEPARFAALGLPVLPDPVEGRPGPLAGVLAAMVWAEAQGAPRVLTAAADTPFLPLDLAARLEAAGPGIVLAATPGTGARRDAGPGAAGSGAAGPGGPGPGGPGPGGAGVPPLARGSREGRPDAAADRAEAGPPSPPSGRRPGGRGGAGPTRHPTFGLWPVALRGDLARALEAGVRKVVEWTDRHGAASALFPDDEAFFNVNTPEDLARARAMAEAGG